MFEYPNTNFHELNLDWILSEIRKLTNTMNDFVVINTIRFEGSWDINKNYARWSIVDDGNGNGYISVKPVSPGILLTNSDYWVLIANYSQLFADVQNRIIELENTSLHTYKNLDSMLSDDNLRIGDMAKTLGYYTAGDDGDGIYIITDNMPVTHYEVLNSGLYAQLVYNTVLNIKSLGAVSNNTGNQSTYLRRAIDCLPNGGVIYFPKGTYRFTEDCRGIRTDNLTFTGDNATLYYDYDRTTTTDFYPVFMIYSKNIVVKGLKFLSNTGVDRANGVHFILAQDSVENLKILNCEFKNSTGAIIYYGSNVKGSLIDGNVLDTSNADGILISDGSEHIIVTNNRITNTGDDAISVVWNDGYPDVPNHIQISNNIITGGFAHGVNVCHAENIDIFNNTIKDCIGGGVSIYRWQTNPVYAKKINIIGNSMLNTGVYGALIDGVIDCAFKDNHIIGGTTSGIYLGNYDNIDIEGNVIDGAPYGIAQDNLNIFATLKDITLKDNIITNYSGNAIALATNTTHIINVIIEGNIMKTDAAVYATIYCSNIDGLVIFNNYQKSGIRAIEGSSGVTQVNNIPA